MPKKPFKGVLKLDVRDSVPDWTPYIPTKAPEGYKSPGKFTGGTILAVGVTVEKEQYLDLEQVAAAAFARD